MEHKFMNTPPSVVVKFPGAKWRQFASLCRRPWSPLCNESRTRTVQTDLSTCQSARNTSPSGECKRNNDVTAI